MRFCALAAALVALGLASPAAAGTITIGFDFSEESSVSALGLIMVPPNGQIFAAFSSLDVPGAGIQTASAGAGTLRSLSISASIDVSLLGNNINGPVQADQIGFADASLTLGLTNLVIKPPVMVDVFASINCMGAVCGLLPIPFPILLMSPQTLDQGFTLMISGLGTEGAGRVSGMFELSIEGQAITINLIGKEVNRTFNAVPEPSSAALAGGALALLAAGRRFRRSRG